MSSQMTTEVTVVNLETPRDKTAKDIAQEIHDLRIEMNAHVDRIDEGLRDGDIQEANLGKRKLSGVVKKFGEAISEYQNIDHNIRLAEYSKMRNS